MENIFEKLITPEMIMGYKSPIEVMVGEMVMSYENDILKAVQDVGIDVDKEELLKALKYDREQYEKGYAEAREKAIDDFAEKLCDELSEKTTDILVDGFKFDVLTLDGVVDIVWEIAERMKNGEINS